MLAIIVACGVFMIAFNSRDYMQNNFFVFIGIAFLFLGFTDFLHMLAYKGMGVFPGDDPNIATQLWIGSGSLRAATFLIAPAFLKIRISMRYVFLSFAVVTLILILSIFQWKVFPVCFVQGTGLTAFKIVSEYIVSIILVIPVIIIYKKKDKLTVVFLNCCLLQLYLFRVIPKVI